MQVDLRPAGRGGAARFGGGCSQDLLNAWRNDFVCTCASQICPAAPAVTDLKTWLIHEVEIKETLRISVRCLSGCFICALFILLLIYFYFFFIYWKCFHFFLILSFSTCSVNHRCCFKSANVLLF